jgi:general secretion pathway protein A
MKDLLTWFGFKHQPFDKSLKTKDMLETGALTECTARLDFMKRSGGIMLLTGDPGVGKTVTLRRFVDALNTNLYHPVYTNLATLSGYDILRHINARLGLIPRMTKSMLFSQIQQELLESREQRGRTIVFIIDEAHLLKPSALEELRLLTNFKMDSFDPFILILAGHSELKRVMDFAVMEPLAQRLRMRYHIAALEPGETQAYLEHHLRVAGVKEPLFDEPAIHALHEVSYGIPRRIGNAATQGLTYAMFSDKRSVSADMMLKLKSAA